MEIREEKGVKIMKLQIKRATKVGKGLLGGAKFEYSCDVQLLASDEEKDLWKKYGYDSENIFVSGGDSEAFATNVKGDSVVSFNSLLEGHTWKAKELYVVFTAIPTVIAQQLRAKHAELNARELWNGQDEVLDLSEE